MNAALASPTRPLATAVTDGPWGRLALCVLASAGLHALLIAGFPVDPIGGEPGEPTVITARLETGPVTAEAAAAPAAADPAAPEAAKPEKPPEPVARSESAVARAPEKTSPLAGPEVPMPRDEIYYSIRQLDVQPSPLTPLRPVCSEAGEFKEEITLLVLINEFGLVDDVGVVKAPPSGLCVQQMLTLLKPVRFSPGIKDGRAVKARAQIVFRPAAE
jgi:protein TonB